MDLFSRWRKLGKLNLEKVKSLAKTWLAIGRRTDRETRYLFEAP